MNARSSDVVPSGRWLPATLASVIAMGAGVACSGGSTAAPSPVPQQSPTNLHPQRPSPSPGTSGSRSPRVKPSPSSGTGNAGSSAILEDGRHLVFLQRIGTDGQPAATVDLTEWYTGKAATQAAVQDGAIQAGEPLPNDYYIRNNNPLLRTIPIAAGAKVVVIDWTDCCATFVGDLGQLAAGISIGVHNKGNYRVSSPYWLRVHGGEIVKIEEQYLP